MGLFLTAPGDGDRDRDICNTCGFINYKNPKVVVGCVVRDASGRVLLARRAIEPRKGSWNLPAGYMECEESLDECKTPCMCSANCVQCGRNGRGNNGRVPSACFAYIRFGSAFFQFFVCPSSLPPGAVREVFEETEAEIHTEGVLALLSIPGPSQVGCFGYPPP